MTGLRRRRRRQACAVREEDRIEKEGKKRGGACWGEPAPPQQRWIGGNHCALLIEFALDDSSVLRQFTRARNKFHDQGTLPEWTQYSATRSRFRIGSLLFAGIDARCLREGY